MPERHGGIDGAKYRGDPEAFAEALRFEGDRLELLRGGDGFTRIDEYKGRRRIFRRWVEVDVAEWIAEDFEERGGTVQWK